MEKEAKQNSSVDFVKWFSEVNKDSGKLVGGKGANLAEIYNLKLPVPPGFVVTAQAYDYFIEKAGIDEEIQKLLENLDYEDSGKLQENTKQIRELILKSEMPKEMQEEILESYEALDTDHIEKSINSKQAKTAIEILNKSPEPVFVAVRSSATAEDLADASFAGQQDSFLNVKGQQELIKHIKKCFSSLFTARATYYRNKKGFKHADVKLAVVVQKMIDADKSGVIFSKDPSYKNEQTIIEAVWGLGEGIVSGKITPDKYIILGETGEIKDKKIATKKIAITRDSSGAKITVKLKPERSSSQVLTDYEIKKLTDYALKLEEHYDKPQDIEFAIENQEIYIVQTRPITTLETRVDSSASQTINAEPILQGLGASPGIASGKIKVVEDLNDLSKIKQGDVFVTEMTNPDMVIAMQKSAAIVTNEGGLTAHAAIVSREIGIPCVVGTGTATEKLKEGEIITVDGFSGKIYKGKVAETQTKEVLPVTEDIIPNKTKIKVIVDLPSSAERAAKSKINAVGLTRIEGIIAESGKHPEYFLKNQNLEEYENIIYKGIQGIAKYFDELWIRTSDIRTDEYANLEGAPKEKEANPMLGFHGIRYSLKKPGIFKAELNALKKISKQGKTIGLLLPQVISVEEVKQTKEILKEIEFLNAKVGVMIETPASVQTIRKLCEEGIDFISFGTNDLTQYTLAIDRGNTNVQYIYNELHPAIFNQIKYVINTCKRFNVETSICGQAGSKKEMVKFLVRKGIDSISVNPDAAQEIAKFVKELEENPEKTKPDFQEIKKESHESKPLTNLPPGETENSNDNSNEKETKNEQENNKEEPEQTNKTFEENLEEKHKEIPEQGQEKAEETSETEQNNSQENNEESEDNQDINELANTKAELEKEIQELEQRIQETKKDIDEQETPLKNIQENVEQGMQHINEIAETIQNQGSEENQEETDKEDDENSENEMYSSESEQDLPNIEEQETISEVIENYETPDNNEGSQEEIQEPQENTEEKTYEDENPEEQKDEIDAEAEYNQKEKQELQEKEKQVDVLDIF